MNEKGVACGHGELHHADGYDGDVCSLEIPRDRLEAAAGGIGLRSGLLVQELRDQASPRRRSHGENAVRGCGIRKSRFSKYTRGNRRINGIPWPLLRSMCSVLPSDSGIPFVFSYTVPSWSPKWLIVQMKCFVSIGILMLRQLIVGRQRKPEHAPAADIVHSRAQVV